MSAVNMKSSKAAYVPRVPCCKVCKDSGEPESVFSSHYVKDREGRVCCPKLLKIQCLRCGKNGHTSGYCTAPVVASKPVQSTRIVPEPTKAVENKPSRFACLVDSDSEDDETLLEKKHSKHVAKKTSATPYTKPPMNNRWNHTNKTIEQPVSNINIENMTDFPSLGENKTNVVTPSCQMSYVEMVAKQVSSKPERKDVAIPELKIQEMPKYRIYSTDCDWANPPDDYYDTDEDDYEKDSYHSDSSIATAGDYF